PCSRRSCRFRFLLLLNLYPLLLSFFSLFFLPIPRPPRSTLFPYTTLFRSDDETVLTQLEISMDVISELAARVPGYLVINAAPALPLPAEVVDRADLIIVNETEYRLLPQLESAKLVAVTYGEHGSALLSHGRQVAFAEALPRTPVSTVGAGDAFCAALTIGLRSGLTGEAALRAANRVGAAAVMDPSARPDFRRFDH